MLAVFLEVFVERRDGIIAEDEWPLLLVFLPVKRHEGNVQLVMQQLRYPLAVRFLFVRAGGCFQGNRLEPRPDGRGIAVRQEIDDVVRLEVDNDGALALSFAPGPVVDADEFRVTW